MEARTAAQPRKTAAQLAFAASGLDIAYVARVVNLSPGYLKSQLRTGCQCYVTAERLRRVLNCPVEYFLPRPKTTKAKERGRATTEGRASK